MRTIHEPKPAWPKDRTKREVRRFLWWPKRIGNETRWLEWADWEEEVVIYVHAITNNRTRWSWEVTKWID